MSSDAFYERMAATAQRLLDSRGGPVTFNPVTTSGYSIANGAPNSTSSDPVTGVGITVEYAVAMIDGSSILRDDRMLILATRDATGELITQPASGHRLTPPDGVVCSVIDCKVVQPAGVPLVYFVQLRR